MIRDKVVLTCSLVASTDMRLVIWPVDLVCREAAEMARDLWYTDVTTADRRFMPTRKHHLSDGT